MKPALVPLALLLAACCTQAAPSGPGAGAETETPEFRIGPDGVAGIRGKTPFTLQAVERAFPGQLVVAGTEGAPPTPVFRVQQAPEAGDLFVVRPDWTLGLIGSVSTTHPAVLGPSGLRIGETTQDALPAKLSGVCVAATCEIRSENGTLTLEFAAGPGAPVLARMSYFVPVSPP